MMKKKFVVCASFSILWCQNDKTSITMKCETIEKKLVFFIENKLEENEDQLVANHLNGCASCASKAEYLRAFWNDLEFEKQSNPNRSFTHVSLLGCTNLPKRKCVGLSPRPH